MYGDEFLKLKLEERIVNDSLRQLNQINNLVDFSSNDYLGIKTLGLAKPFLSGDEEHGSGGARTLSGNYALIEDTEAMIANFHCAEAALIFNSGYCANLGLMSAVPQNGDTIFYDFLSHASLRDGIRLSGADAFSFRHNDMEDLEQRLEKANGNRFVVTESVFSMDGDMSPLARIIEICERFGAHLIVDEAHATGIIGPQGEGLVQMLGLEERVFARIHTFGKALGAHGAAIVGSARLKSYLVNFARSFIFTTALPQVSVQAIRAAYSLFPDMDVERTYLRKLIGIFSCVELPFEKLLSHTPIQAVLIPGNKEVKAMSMRLQLRGIDVRPILYPTVPKGRERLRINLHSFNTAGQLEEMVERLREGSDLCFSGSSSRQ